MVGIGIVIAGLLTLSGVSAASLTGRASIGDMLFIAAGSLWAGFGVLMRKFRLDPILATAVAGDIRTRRLCALLSRDGGNGSDRAPPTDQSSPSRSGCRACWQATGTVYTYAKTVQLLGAGKAAIFPALIPGLATLMGWPILGHIPTLTEAIGLHARGRGPAHYRHSRE